MHLINFFITFNPFNIEGTFLKIFYEFKNYTIFSQLYFIIDFQLCLASKAHSTYTCTIHYVCIYIQFDTEIMPPK